VPLALTPRLLRRGLELFAIISIGGVALLVGYYVIFKGERIDEGIVPLVAIADPSHERRELRLDDGQPRLQSGTTAVRVAGDSQCGRALAADQLSEE